MHYEGYRKALRLLPTQKRVGDRPLVQVRKICDAITFPGCMGVARICQMRGSLSRLCTGEANLLARRTKNESVAAGWRDARDVLILLGRWGGSNATWQAGAP